MTPSNTCRSAWTDAAIGRDTGDLVTAEIEPFRNGDLSVAVTNAGEYAFLLEKGEEYALSFFPPSSNITISAVDDVAATRGPPLRSGWTWGDVNAGSWVADIGMYVTDYFPGMASAYCSWLPTLCGTPDVLSIPDEETVRFYAHLLDYAHLDDVAFEWGVCDGLVAATPDERETDITVESAPSWSDALVSVVATLGSGFHLCSWLDFSVFGGYDPHPVDPLSWIELSVPRAMFANDDDDNNDGTNDWEKVSFSGLLDNHGGVPLEKTENDVVSVSVSFHSTVATSGTIRVSVSGFDGDVYMNKTEASLVAPTFDVPVERSSGLSIPLYFNPYSPSSHLGPSVTATWIPEGGAMQTRTARFMVVEPVVEPIYSETKTVSGHVYTFNPCGVAVDDDAYFKVDVSPAAFPDSDIEWRCEDGKVEFVGGDRGREVHVRGRYVGEAELEVIIGGRTYSAPNFTLNVVTQRLSKITAWIVTGKNGIFPCSVADVQNMISPLNDIYRQVGVSFYLDSVTITNIPNAYNAFLDTPSTPSSMWTFDDIVDIDSGTGGVECYFINSFVDQSHVKAAHNSHGIVVTTRATRCTLAHEIGHAFGMCDIYLSNADQKEESDPLLELLDSEKASYLHMDKDWNGGCLGFGDGGARYYRGGTSMKDVVCRMVMLGEVSGADVRQDISAGSVYGVYYEDASSQSRIWFKDAAPVGFPWTGKIPVHQQEDKG